ncbi:DUF4350 domain-containing protein [Catenuloplanes atrovinosus]|uniref:DUF4350 domain-containing protein n=1 Tax=Catenuloplanes atrovinosus TaxID=137266 RepID=A0AAE4CCG5_9ACTN|nr:DUF4350 domain-containing protein [Catenuloplanes atrovinosus]MDR7279163.1 hypothetical protein [Catenuloplanes atrovinosus]
MRRRYRIIIPVAVALALLLVTGVTYAIEEPDPSENTYLSPAVTEGTGGSALRRALAAAGVDVQHLTKTSDALLEAYRGNATLFIPAPEAIHPEYLRMLELLPPTTRIVLVAPAAPSLRAAGLAVSAEGRRWTTRAVAPDAEQPRPCWIEEARAAGVAAALRQRYDGAGPACYGQGLIRALDLPAETYVIGTGDPFRNDRIREHGNERLAVGLLGTRARMIWLDRHRLEPPPLYTTARPNGPEAPPSLYPDDTSADDGTPYDRPAPDGSPQPGGAGENDGDAGSGGDGDDDRAAAPERPDNPMFEAFPPWFWAMLVLLAVAALVTALWRARRLGPPVVEPLPVQVRAHETVLGRGRLYRRARAAAHSAEILREAARQRLAHRLRLPPEADLSAAVAAYLRADEREARQVLYDFPVTDDGDLVWLAGALHDLTTAVTHEGDDR